MQFGEILTNARMLGMPFRRYSLTVTSSFSGYYPSICQTIQTMALKSLVPPQHQKALALGNAGDSAVAHGP